MSNLQIFQMKLGQGLTKLTTVPDNKAFVYIWDENDHYLGCKLGDGHSDIMELDWSEINPDIDEYLPKREGETFKLRFANTYCYPLIIALEEHREKQLELDSRNVAKIEAKLVENKQSILRLKGEIATYNDKAKLYMTEMQDALDKAMEDPDPENIYEDIYLTWENNVAEKLNFYSKPELLSLLSKREEEREQLKKDLELSKDEMWQNYRNETARITGWKERYEKYKNARVK